MFKPSKLFFLILILFSGVILDSCGPKVTPLPFYKLTDEFKSYCLFQAGSRWTYVSSATADTTDVSIATVEENMWYQNITEEFNYEAFDMITNENSVGIAMIELTAGSTLNAVTTMNSLMRYYYSDGTYRLVFDAKYPLGESQILGEAEGVYENVEVLPELWVNGTTYSSVYHTKVTDYYEQGFGDFDFYIAKNYGLIKSVNYVNNDTITVELLNSSLVQ